MTFLLPNQRLYISQSKHQRNQELRSEMMTPHFFLSQFCINHWLLIKDESTYPIPGDFWKCMKIFLVVVVEEAVLALNGQRPAMLLKISYIIMILQCICQPLMTENYLASNVSCAEIAKPCHKPIFVKGPILSFYLLLPTYGERTSW